MKIGFIGSGVMGSSMIKNLIDAKHQVYVYTRTKAKAFEVIEHGAIWCETPKDVALNSDVILTMVGYPSDVKEVYLGSNGIIEGVSSGKIVVDMTTSTPSLAKELYTTFKELGVASIDAPVSGGDVGAKNATLTIMCGGDIKAFNTVLPVFEAIGKTIILQGAPGAGHHTKMCNQIALAGSLVGMIEYIAYAKSNGLDPKKVMDSIGIGSAQSTAMQVYAPRLFNEDYQPGFYIKHIVKDLKIAIDECEKTNTTLPGLKLAYELYKKLEDDGYGELGTQALIKYYLDK